MKVSLRWLAEWVESPWPPRELGSRLTMAGFELEARRRDLWAIPSLELNVTPNRGDAMSVIGIAREVAALSGMPLRGPTIEPVAARSQDTLPVELAAPEGCPRFAGRIIRGVDNRAKTPAWMQERLQLAGIRSISPIVDVTNYVMLELGQPMHAYDLAKLKDGIRVRLARAGEKVTLLDDTVIEAQADVLLITDGGGAIGLAGIMGGGEHVQSAKPPGMSFSRPHSSRLRLCRGARDVSDCRRTQASDSSAAWILRTRRGRSSARRR